MLLVQDPTGPDRAKKENQNILKSDCDFEE